MGSNPRRAGQRRRPPPGREKGGGVGAAVEKAEDRRVAPDGFFGHRKRGAEHEIPSAPATEKRLKPAGLSRFSYAFSYRYLVCFAAF